MSANYDKLVPALKSALPDEALDLIGRVSMFIRRLREVRASLFVWSVIMSRFDPQRPGFKAAGEWFVRLGGKEIWRCPFQKRFKTQRCVALFAQAFERLVARWRQARVLPRHPLTKLVSDIVIVDGTTIQLADELRPVFKGTGRSGRAALMKVVLAISAFGGVPLHTLIGEGAQHDSNFFPPLDLFRVGTLFLFDRGFFSHERLAAIAAAGHRYLCPVLRRCNPLVVGAVQAPRRVRAALARHPEGIPLRELLGKDERVVARWDLDVVFGDAEKSRLVVLPATARSLRQRKKKSKSRAHFAYFTNLDRAAWSPQALRETYRIRWQIELVFKELKQNLNLESVPTKDRHAAQVFVWASLLALGISRCVCEWLSPPTEHLGLATETRRSLISRELRKAALMLGYALSNDGAAAVMREVLIRELKTHGCGDATREDSFERVRKLMIAA